MTNEPLQKYGIISVTSLFFIFLNDKMIIILFQSTMHCVFVYHERLNPIIFFL